MNISEEAIEKAARALYASFDGGNEPPLNWDKDLDGEGQENVRNFARAALSAAAPTLMAMALRDAADDWETAVSDPTPRSGAYADGWMRNRANKIKEQL
jgi:hypothetical protein